MPELVRAVNGHEDGHGLNDRLAVSADAADGSGASHRYEALIDGRVVGFLQFQKGPRHEPGSTEGVTEAVVLSILIDRLRGFQAGPYGCRENAIILTKLEECLLWTKARADARAKRGVLGKHEK